MDRQETILFAPLNWGLGHATRLVPLIQNALNEGHKIIIAADGVALNFLKLEFPNSKAIVLKGYRAAYAAKPFFLLYLLLQMPLLFASILLEHFRLKQLIKKYNISQVISDNRYGLWNKNIKSIFISHQLFIQLPKSLKFLEPLLHRFIQFITAPFNEFWLPDYEKLEESLAGKLSHGKILANNTKYIGPLSRFSNYNSAFVPNGLLSYDVLVLVSGPEPQRSHFEKEMTARYMNTDKTVLMVCGRPQSGHSKKEENRNITKVPHLNTPELYYHLNNSKHIVARSGYSTLMDLHVLGLKAELHPTPGQTEQEYLAVWWKQGENKPSPV